jgi:hypothetical protein
MNLNSPVKGLFWNHRGIRKKGLASYIRDMMKDHKFDFLYFQETMVEDFLDSCLRQVGPGKEYLWDWAPSSGKSGGIMSGLNWIDLMWVADCRVTLCYNTTCGISSWGQNGTF